MRRDIGIWIVVGLAAGLLAAPGALAASPKDIYRDLADNGRLDKTYSQQDLRAYLQSAAVQGYGNPVIVTPVTPPTSGVAGAQKTITKPKQKPGQTSGVAGAQSPPLAQTASAGTLPFTGSELGIFALVGAALLAGGFVLRASSRGR